MEFLIEDNRTSEGGFGRAGMVRDRLARGRYVSKTQAEVKANAR